MRKSVKKETTHAGALVGVGGAAAAAFAVLTAKSLKPRTILSDLRLRRLIPSYPRPARKAAFRFGLLGKELAVIPAAGLISAGLLRDGRKAGAAAILSATTSAIAASHIFDAVLPQKTPPPGRKAPFDPHFPSGHALHSASLLAISAWVLTRENLADRKLIAAGAGASAFLLGVDRLIQDRHWPTDVLAGWLAAISIASFAASGYERARR